jgi:hypothetical protein
MMRKISLIISFFMVLTLCVFAQGAKKPKLMVVPSDVWCSQHGYTSEYEDDGTIETLPDYKKALQNDTELHNVIAKINTLMADRGFPLISLEQTMKSITTMAAEDRLIQSKTTSARVSESPLDRLRRTAKSDIILQLTWNVNTIGPKKSITYSLEGLDAYSNKQVAGVEGTGAQSFSADIAVMLEEAVMNNMDQFCSQLQNHFEDLINNGREVTLDLRVFENDLGIDFEKEFNGTELSEIIDDWMAQNTVNHSFNKSDATENYILFDQVRIPIYKENGMPMDTEAFARNLAKVLRTTPYNIPVKVVNRGLGRCLLILGSK